MATYRTRVTADQRAAEQARTQVITDLDLLNQYLGATIKERETQFADTARTAEIAGLSQRTIQLWIDIGLLQALRIGKNYKVSLDSLRRYLESRIDG